MSAISKADWAAAQALLHADPLPVAESSMVAVTGPDGQPLEVLTPGEVLAQVDIARLAEADLLAKRAAKVREDARNPELGVTGAELAEAQAWAERAAELRALVRSFAKDREDKARGRGRWRPLAVHGPARAFASAVELSPADWCACTECGVQRDLDYEGQVHGRTRASKYGPVRYCGGVFRRGWTAPETSERFAMAAAREAGRRLAEETGSSVEYVEVRDPVTGAWLRTEARQDVGFELVLRAEQSLRPARLPGADSLTEIKARVEARREESREAVNWACKRAEARARADGRRAGKKTGRGRRGGRRGRK